MRLYNISDKYINYLRKTFQRIYSNKEESRVHKRKYLGTVIELSGYKYYIPLSSPKEKHDYIVIEGKKTIRKDSLIVLRIISGSGEKKTLKGTLQIGSMIPVPDSEIELYNVNEEPDKKYRELVWEEIMYIRKNENKIRKYAQILYNKKSMGNMEKIVVHCLDFKGVEKCCDKWIQENNISFI